MREVSAFSLLLFLLLFLPTSIAAQEVRSITMAEALEMAGTHSIQVRQSRADVDRAGLAFDEARAGRLPNVTVDGQYSNNLALPVIVLPPDSPFGDAVLRTGSRHNFSTSLQVTVPIYNRQLNRGIDLSQAMYGLEVALYEATSREVEVEVQRAFLNGLITEQAYAVLVESHETLQRNLELIEALHAEGMAPEYDVIRTEVQVRNLEPELSRALNNHRGALNYVKLLTGISVAEEVRLEGSLEELYATLPPLDYEAHFMSNREVIQVEAQRELVDIQLAMEQATYWPTVSAFGNFSYQGQGDDLAIWGYNWNETAMVGVSVSFPLFVAGRRQRVDQIEVERRQVEMQRDFLIESLHSQFETTISRIEELESMIQAQQRNIAQAERGYAIARASYEEGVHSLMEVNDAEGALRESRLNYAMALADYINAVLDMEDLVGSTITTSVYGIR